MDAILFDDFESSRVATVETPSPGSNEVLVDVSRVQLSVTECLLYRGADIIHHNSVARRLQDGPARLFGHEFCGRAVEVGDDVTTVEEGERVYAPGKIHCGSCMYCRSGYANLCTDTVGIGYNRPGALAEYVSIPADPLCTLPDGVSNAAGAALQPMASSLLCAVDADIDPGDTVVVFGTGVMGFQCALSAKRLGAGDVYSVDVRSRPLEIAEENGLIPIDARKRDPIKTVREGTDGLGADIAFEAVGGDQSHATTGDDPLAQSFDAIRRGGTVVQVGHITGDMEMTPRTARSKCARWVNPEKGTKSVTPGTTTGELAGQFVADGDVPIESFITHELDGLEEFETAVDITLEKSDYDALGPAQLVLN
ncbi:alcohol dehydrogenase catalytic domain-containing protein [Natronolimnobius sp. AArcel1]|uniref:zinc-dependent alcohol dehydrogenase n=1 Tax=Natronolimnobius sp. AArcel1 TaxID=1679093 RepID=UPI0013EADD05|nr:alcohol dehydrogenase catalytic domain-containing protein [Natronolimnobius sp. AArcel1]NGM71311.1 alcohol dehydrogenase catalytic domain-containing protein [Natronolimnobius sp. AArcel1]